ncbi:hypothetical protein BD769DRAFT_1429781 [Suillus cothurnatus]|nr:hypothetical protein BD769DRAFT_1429781 [Suillus cothurnatus]
MLPRVYLGCYWLLLLSCTGVRFSSIEIFIRYDVRVITTSTRSSITLRIYASDTKDTVIKIDLTHLFSLRERNISNGQRCMMGRPGE